MIITHKMDKPVDLVRHNILPTVNVVQGDANTRAVEISLYAAGAAWPVPSGTSVLVRFGKPDGTGGTYDTLPDGSPACSATGNTVTVILAPQVLARPGLVLAQVEMIRGQLSLATFTIKILVEADPSIGTTKSEDYVNMSKWISSEINLALTEAKKSGVFDGADGPQGPAGTQGEAGKSAYQYAQDAGFVGTEEEFAALLMSNSIKQYGAAGDGVTDDTAAFQAALAAERVVSVPGGTYLLSGGLVIRENCCLELSQDTVLMFTQTDKNCITLLRCAHLKGNHATIFVPYTFNAKVINSDTADDEAVLDQDNLVSDNTTAVPPFKKWDPQWKMSRYITDINICKPNSSGFHYSDNGKCYGTAVYMGCSEGIADYMWGVAMSGLRIAGGFTYGIHMVSEGETWNHDARIEAVIDACETAVCIENSNFTRLAVTIQPRPAADGTAYAKHGIKLVDSRGIDLSSSRVWDWNANTSLWTEGGEYQHIAMYGQCRGLILDDYLYHEMSGHDIRSLIYTDTASNLEQMTIRQEPITRWFKPVDGTPYFYDGFAEKKLITEEHLDAHFDTDVVKNFTDVLATAIDTDGSIYNEIGYKMGIRAGTDGSITESAYYGTTGFIPCVKGSQIYAEDLSFAVGDAFCRIILVDANFNYVIHVNQANLVKGDNYYVGYEETNNGFVCTLNNISNLNNVAYARFVIYKTQWGEHPMMAVDEEIKYTVEGFLADGVKVKGENVVGNLPGGGTVTDEQVSDAVAAYMEEHPIEVPEGGTSIDVTAEVGQTILVEEIDANGKPTKWKAVDYQPRTHWQGEKVMVPEQTFEAGLQGKNITIHGDNKLMGLTVGKTYTVVFDGVTYTWVAEEGVVSLDGITMYNAISIGNLGMFGGADNGLPFILADVLDYEPPNWTCVPYEYGTHTLSVTGVDETDTIPEKFVNYTPALPYYIEVTGSGTTDDPYVCSDTVKNVEANYDIGRSIVVRLRGANSFGVTMLPLSMSVDARGGIDGDGDGVVDQTAFSVYGVTFLFMGLTYASASITRGMRLYLSPTEDGTYEVTENLGD